jgi:uncharacterized protein (DUF3820 family)
MVKLTDKSPMPFGKHQGTAMANVPPDYLIWLHDMPKLNPEVKEYISENMDVLQEEVKKNGSKFLK